MKKRLPYLTSIMLSLLVAQASNARDNIQGDASLVDFQAAMINHIDMVGSPALQQRLADLTHDQWQAMFQMMPDRTAFIDATIAMESLAFPTMAIKSIDRGGAEAFNLGPVNLDIANSFVPAYPSGGDYDTFTATMPGLGLLNDSPDIGTETGTALNDERCDTNGEAGALIALAVLKVAAEVGNTACASTPSPFEPAVCIPAGVLNEAVIADEIVLDQCGYQTALVDSAEIEAAYENSVEVIGTVNDIDLIINDETNFTDDAELATHDTDISNALATHDTDIKTDLATHDTDIKTNLATHDTDVKALLATLQAGVDANGAKLDVLLARQLEVVRLLHTPQGRRSTDIPACDGGPCTWNP